MNSPETPLRIINDAPVGIGDIERASIHIALPNWIEARKGFFIHSESKYLYPSPDEDIFPIPIWDSRLQRAYELTRDENGGLVLTEVAQDE